MEAKRECRMKREKYERPGGKEVHNDGKRRNRRRAVRCGAVRMTLAASNGADEGRLSWRVNKGMD
jgi:hypothetical protein